MDRQYGVHCITETGNICLAISVNEIPPKYLAFEWTHRYIIQLPHHLIDPCCTSVR